MNPNIAMAQKYYEEHGYYPEGSPLPLYGTFEVGTKEVNESGDVVIKTTTTTGKGTEVIEDMQSIGKGLEASGQKIFIGAVIILVLALAVGLAT